MNQLHGLFSLVWTAREIQANMKKDLLMKLPKSEDLLNCSKWRGIALLLIASKDLSSVILEWKKNHTDRRQRGRQTAGKTDHVLTRAQHSQSPQNSRWRDKLLLYLFHCLTNGVGQSRVSLEHPTKPWYTQRTGEYHQATRAKSFAMGGCGKNSDLYWSSSAMFDVVSAFLDGARFHEYIIC